MTASKAKGLLRLAEEEKDRLHRHLLVAAALGEAFSSDPIVVGGTAEEFWTAAEYHETDLDLCCPVGADEEKVLHSLGFRQEGRHWVRHNLNVAVEFPDSKIDGDEQRTRLEPVTEDADARIIGLDDLYLDRLRQATMQEGVESIEFQSALAVVAGAFDAIDWSYVGLRIDEIEKDDPLVGGPMRRLDAKIRRRVRRSLVQE